MAIYVKSGGDANRVKAYGAGLQSALVNENAEFVVDTRVGCRLFDVLFLT